MYKSYSKFMHQSRTTKTRRGHGPKRFGQWSSTPQKIKARKVNKIAAVPEEAKHLHPNEARKRYPELQKKQKKRKRAQWLDGKQDREGPYRFWRSDE